MLSSRRFFFDCLAALLLLAFTGAGVYTSAAATESQVFKFPVYLPVAVNRYSSDPADVIILPSSNHYRTPRGSLHVLGEVRNDTSATIHHIWVTARLYDRNNSFLSSAKVMMLDTLSPGERSCFDVVFDPPPSSWYRYEFDPAQFETGPAKPRLTLESSDGYPDTDGGGNDIYVVDGQVRNRSGIWLYEVKAVATLYNARNQVVSCLYNYTQPAEIPPVNNTTANFEITFWDRESYDDVRDFHLMVSTCPY